MEADPANAPRAKAARVLDRLEEAMAELAAAVGAGPGRLPVQTLREVVAATSSEAELTEIMQIAMQTQLQMKLMQEVLVVAAQEIKRLEPVHVPAAPQE